MATIDLGKIKLVWRGTYAGGTDYTVDDVVQHTDNGLTSSFICTANSTGNAPSTGGSVHGSWAYLAKGSGDATLTTQGDVLYYGGSGLARLGAGTSGQFLKTQGAGANPVWATPDSGKTLGIKMFSYSTRHSGVAQTGARQPLWNVGTFTKVKADTTLKIDLVIPGGGAASNYPHFATDYIRFSTTNYDTNGSDIFGYIHNTRVDNLTFGANLIGNFLYDTTGSNISGTGTVYISIGYDSANSSAVHPFAVWNPNSNEDARSRQAVSYLVVTELDF